MAVESGPASGRGLEYTPEQFRTQAFARLRNQVWDSSQHLSYDEIREYVDGVLREIESDEP